MLIIYTLKITLSTNVIIYTMYFTYKFILRCTVAYINYIHIFTCVNLSISKTNYKKLENTLFH